MMQDDPDYGYYYEKEENSRNPVRTYWPRELPILVYALVN